MKNKRDEDFNQYKKGSSEMREKLKTNTIEYGKIVSNNNTNSKSIKIFKL